MRELDSETMRRAMVVVDHLPAAWAGAGDVIQARVEGALEEADVTDLASLPSRSSDEQITVFKSVGLAVQDAFAADAIYQRARSLGLGIPFG
jgi:ornithine cyclodeaminase/alanine dehydrogenase-like protein (mu-crystallin family)